jgi:hypothetical protein
LEPSFAAIARQEGAECHGVLLKLKRRAYERLLRTEGGGGVTPGYIPIKVTDSFQIKKTNTKQTQTKPTIRSPSRHMMDE